MDRELDDKIGALGLQDHDAPDLADSNEHRSAEQREQRNFTHSQICQLAPELLGRILSFVQVAQTSPHYAPPWLDLDEKWVDYTLVCRYIRFTAVETPYLWKSIQCDPFWPPSDLTRLYVARAKGCALDVSVIPGLKTPSWIKSGRSIDTEVRTYFTMARRVWLSFREILHADVRQTPADFVFGELFAGPMPKLEQFYGNMHEYKMRLRSLEGVAASLTRLCLDVVAFESDWSFPHLPLLRHLQVGSVMEGQPGIIMAMVAYSPCLETLHITLWGFPTGGVRPAPPVQLPLLQDLKLQARTEEQIICCVRSIPVPKHSLYIHARSPFSSDKLYMRAIGPYMLDFWAQTAGRQPFPDTIVTLQRDADSIVIGEKFTLDDVAPHLQLFCEAVYHTEDGLGDISKLVHTLHVIGRHWSARAPTERGSSWPHVQHVIVDDVKCGLPDGFNDWIRGRAEAGRPLQSVTFSKANSDLEMYAKELKEGGLVGEVNCHWDR
jgi:hypothetical protein